MTELTGSPEAAQPSPDWPRLDTAAISDRVVAQALTRLDALPQAPAAEHEAAYSRLHDELLEALNADPENAQPTDNQLGGA
jgi:hypothetical protein